ncbi:hypothetical protein BD413DRAFT_501261 [Trametes elegans]|nr:hypothetical protein BD413DRAFT_501261 [Trametes elegans]
MDLPTPFVFSRKQTKSLNPPEHLNVKAHKDYKKKLKAQNLEETPEKDNGQDDHHGKSAIATAKDKAKYTGLNKAGHTSEVNTNAVPAPASDSGIIVTAIHPGILPVVPPQAPTTLTVSAHSLTPGFSPLPPLTALATSSALTAVLTPTGTPGGTLRALSDGKPDQEAVQGSKHLPAVAIVLVSVGLGFLLLGAYVVWSARRRPRKRSCPTPSLPIFQDPFADQEVKADEESLFGGKERTSAVARPNSNGLWTWTQYTPKVPVQALGSSVAPAQIAKPEPVKAAPNVLLSEKMETPLTTAPIHVPLPINSPPEPPLQQMQSALSRAANRVSSLSMSIYPTSPRSTSGIGLALGGTSPLTADGTPVLQRKPSASRLSKGRRSMRHSLAATEYLDMMHTDIYGGAQVTSPFVLSPKVPPIASTLALPKSAMRKSTFMSSQAQNQSQGRARVKAPYHPGSGAGLRSSSTVAGITTLARGNRSSVMVPSDETQFMLSPLSPAPKSDARRERDTRALTSAMGLVTPDLGSLPPVSPQPTLYPDDSITLAGDRQHPRAGTREKGAKAHNRAQSEAMSPGMEASARLGNLMLAEFTSMASLPSTRTVANAPGTGPGAGTGGGVAASTSKPRVTRKNVRAEDKPPRVPSPPPLPSLAQMAMAHGNPDEYADYRSPTYSIYGLYEADRKSRMQSVAEF